jgi:5-(aminomethyl)-3-furanmethanol phosphate kinase
MPLNAPLSKLTVVKLGGSLAYTPQCAAWLDLLAKWGVPLILVPGGGPFADCVARAQGAMGFDDLTAHRMALVAMGQFGIALAAHSDAFTAAATHDELDCALAGGKIPVWLPEKMVLDAAGVPASWEVTSDTLAAWLAGVSGACRLLLIKSLDIPAPFLATELAARKIVDPAFPIYAAKTRVAVWVAGPASLASAASLLKRGGMPGSAVIFP